MSLTENLGFRLEPRSEVTTKGRVGVLATPTVLFYGTGGLAYGEVRTAATIGADLTKPAALVASDLGRPIYERLGFVATLRVTYWLGMR